MTRLGDVIVLLPGITGSILRLDGKDVWAPTARGFLNAVLTRGGDLQRLRLEHDPEDLLDLGDGVTVGPVMPTVHLVPGFWKIDGYAETSDALRAAFSDVKPGRNFFEFAYDWRRSNRITAKLLQARAQEWLARWRKASDGNPAAKLILVAHSMGGLVSRYFLEVLEGWRDTRALITFGTPFSGSVNALDFLANGYRKALGIVDLTELLRSCTSAYQLLPTYRCCSFAGGDLARVDGGRIAGLDPAKVADALRFHQEIADKVAEHASLPEYVATGYRVYPIVGTNQPTLESARVTAGGDKVEVLASYLGQDWDGDGTVPRVSATPPESRDASQAMFTATRHASLQIARAVLHHLDGVLSGLFMTNAVLRRAPETSRPAPPVRLGLTMDDAFETDEPIALRVHPDRDPPPLRAVIQHAGTGSVVADVPLGSDLGVDAPPLRPGLYRVTVQGDQTVEPVVDVFEVFSRASAWRAPLRAAPASPEPQQIEWSRSFTVVDATDVPAVRAAIDQAAARYVVLRRPPGHLYAFRPSEVPQEWLELETLSPGPLDAHASSEVRFGNELEGALPPPAAAPPGERAVWVSDRGEPLAIGAEARRHLGMERSPAPETVAVRGAPSREAPRTAPVARPGSTSVTRHPSIDLAGEVRPKATVELTVDLLLQRDDETETTGLTLHVPADWTELPVRVLLSAPDLVFAPDTNEGVVTIRSGQRSIPWKTRAQVADDLGGREKLIVRAAFTFDGRPCGSAKRGFPVAGAPSLTTPAPQAVPETPPPSAPRPETSPVPLVPPLDAPTHHTAGRASLRRGGPAPKLTIRILRIDDSSGTFQWHVDVPDDARGLPGLPKRLGDFVKLGTDAPSFVAALFENFELLPPGGHMAFFQGIGDDLWARTPPCFKDAYGALVGRYGPEFPIQIVSDDPYIPWELMRPSRTGERAEFLGVKHPVGRWFCDYEGALRASIPRGKVFTVAPNYVRRPELKALPWAQAESAAIVKALGTEARPEPGLKDGVLALLADDSRADIGLLHFAGHGSCAVQDTKFAVLYLQDRDLGVYELRRLETKLGEHRHPLVFLNACQVARSGLNLGVVGGFAEALMHREFGGLVAPLWAVYDDQASRVTSEFVTMVMNDGTDFATALRAVRRAHGAESPTFLSYVYYGDVMARFEGR
jgi:hypothetical protein